MTKQKIDSEIIKARNRARSHFRRESQRYEERSLDEARSALRRAEWKQNRTEDVTRNSSIVGWVTGMSSTVLASLDITPRMEVVCDGYIHGRMATGMTNFREIKIRINDKAYDENDPAKIARLIALTKGMIYHEGGHILYTTPFGDLVEVSKTQGFCPKDTDHATRVSDRMLWHRAMSQYQWAWNLLEDQRMECAVVRTSPVIERYFQVIVLDVVVGSIPPTELHRAWPFVTGRSYLPKNLLSAFRKIAVEYAQANDLVDTLNGIDQVVRDYKRATTEADMLRVVERAYPLFMTWLGGASSDVDDHGEQRRRPDGQPNPDPSSSSTDSDGWSVVVPMPPSESDNTQPDPTATPTPSSDSQTGKDQDSSDQNDPTVGKSGKDGSEDDNEITDESGDTTDTGDTDEDDILGNEQDDQPSSNEHGQAGSCGSDAPISTNDEQKGLDEQIKDALNNIVNEAIGADAVNDLISKVNDAERRGVPFDPSIEPMPEKLVEATYEVRAGMLNVLEPLAVQADPAWRFRQDSGVLDPVSFRYREPGETDYWANLDDTGATGHDIALSVILDVSYSMDSHTNALSVGALGIRLACDELGIPCTLSTFDDNGFLMMEADEPTRLIKVSAHGGTDPLEALEDLVNQRADKSRHLVVVFTDGAWPQSISSMAPFRSPGSFMIGVGFGYGVAEAMDKYGFDAVIGIESVSQLPAEVTKALVGYLA